MKKGLFQQTENIENEMDFFKKKKYFTLDSNSTHFSLAMLATLFVFGSTMLPLAHKNMQEQTKVSSDFQFQKKEPTISTFNTLFENNGLNNFSLSVIKGVFSYDNNNYIENINNQSQNFSETGWNNFLKSLEDSGNLTLLKNKSLQNINMQPLSFNMLKIASNQDGFSWEIDIPAILSFKSNNKMAMCNLRLEMQVLKMVLKSI